MRGESSADQVVQRFLAVVRQVSREASIDCVHQLRTNSRRVQSLLFLHPDVQGKSAKKLVKHLRKVRRAAGAVRDLDVQSEWLRGVGPAADSILKSFASKRKRAAARLVTKVGEELELGMRRRLLKLRRALATAESLSSTALTEAVLDRSKTISNNFNVVNVENLHEFRIECKRIRYMAELVTGHDTSASLVKKLKRAQDEIGAWHDWCTLTATVAAHKHTTAELNETMRRNEQEHLELALHAAARAKRAVRAFISDRPRRKRIDKGGQR